MAIKLFSSPVNQNMQKILNQINNQFLPPASGNYLPVYDPSRGIPYAEVPDSNEEDLEAAVTAARAAFPAWSATTPQERHDLLMKLADLIDREQDTLARMESIDNGKPLSLANSVDIPRAASNFRFFASAITQFSGAAHSMNQPDAINYTLRQPLGVVACIAPWNLPLYLFTWKIAPALAAGNTVVAKPSEVTPMTAFRLAQLSVKAGFPPGVLNIIHGTGAGIGNAISTHPQIKAISFTGSTTVGGKIASLAAPRFKKLSLEMGGKNPNIIFADCDYEQMLETTLRSSFANQGQICLCGSRIMVERPLYEKFKKDFTEKTKQLIVGPPMDKETTTGAIVSELHLNKILGYFKIASTEGGQFLTGGKRKILKAPYHRGYYVEPTIIEGLTADCRTNQEEIFGPVVTIMPFDEEAEVLDYANDIPYGLSATIWTQNLSRAHRMAKNIEAGIVWINTWMLRDLRTPFGGVKASGVGREGGWEALRFFTEMKNVCIKW